MISQRDKSLALCGVLFICLLGLLVITPQKIAYAQCSECSCVEDYHGDPNPFAPGTLRRYIYDQHQITQLVFGTAQPIPNTPWTCAGAGIVGTGRLGQHQQFLLEELFLGCSGAGGILPALMMMRSSIWLRRHSSNSWFPRVGLLVMDAFFWQPCNISIQT